MAHRECANFRSHRQNLSFTGQTVINNLVSVCFSQNMSSRLHYPQPYEVLTPHSKVDVIDNGERCQRHATNMFSIPEDHYTRLKGRRQINTYETFQLLWIFYLFCWVYETIFVFITPCSWAFFCSLMIVYVKNFISHELINWINKLWTHYKVRNLFRIYSVN